MCLILTSSYFGSDHIYKVFGQMEQEKQARQRNPYILGPLRMFLAQPVEVRKQHICIHSHYLAAAGKLERGLRFEP